MNRQFGQIVLWASVIGISLVGCATVPPSESSTNTSSFPGRVTEENKPVSVFDRIRFANDLQIQDYRKGDSVTYNHFYSGITYSLSEDERQIATLEGAPDYVRHFKTALNKRVDEWLYEKKDYQIQFKDGELVYFAPIDEQAKLVLENGQPTQVFTRIQAGGQQNEFFWYKWRNKMVVFVNGKLITEQ